MTDQLEKNLRKALEPVDPGELFVERILARLPDQTGSSVIPLRKSRKLWKWAPVALAASLVAGVLVRHEWQLQRELEDGRIAREQLLEALRVTSEKLDVAYKAVHQEPVKPRDHEDTTI